MGSLLILLIVIGSPSAATANRVDKRPSRYNSIADGWRRTNRGWENTASWNLFLTGASLGTVAAKPETNFATITVNRLSTVHPLAVASAQFAGAMILLMPRREEKRGSLKKR